MPSNIYIARFFKQYPGPSLRFLKISATRLLQDLNCYRDFSKAYGIEKSAVGEHFIEAGRGKVKELMGRPLGQLRFCAVLIDGTPFRDRQMIVALGIGCDGKKTVLGLREGATENLAPVNI